MPQRNVTALPQRAGSTTPSIAPSYPLSRADRAAHAAGSFVRAPLADVLAAGWFPSAVDRDSDPRAARAYRRALRRSTAAVADIEAERARVVRDQVEAAYAEYDDEYRTEYLAYVDEVAA